MRQAADSQGRGGSPCRGWGAGAVCSLLLVLLAGVAPRPARAQAPAGFQDVAVPSLGRQDPVVRVGPRFEGLLLPAPVENAEVIWSFRRSLLQKGEGATEPEKLRALAELGRDLGWRGLPVLSAALLVEAERSLGVGRRARAAFLADWAVRLSPHEPGPRWGAAVIQLRALALGEAAASFGGWLRLLGTEPLQRQRVLARLFLHLGPALLLTLLVLLVVAGLRSRDLLAHDLGHVLPAGASPAQRGGCALLLGVGVLLLPGGVLGLLVGWSVLFAPYLRLRERALVLVALGLLAAYPTLAPRLDAAWALPGGLRATLYRIQQGILEPGDLERLARAAQQRPDDPLLRFTQALHAKRTGDTYRAADHVAAVLRQDPDHRQAQLLAASLDLALRRVGEGRAQLQAIAQRWPDSLAAHFNLYRIAQVLPTNDSKAPETLAAARRLDDAAVDRFLDDANPGSNRFLMDEVTPPAALLAATHLDLPPRPLFLALAGPWLWGRLPAAQGQRVSLAAMLLVLLVWLLASRSFWAHPCRSCGRALCTRCHPLVGGTHHCEACTPGLRLREGDSLVPSTVLERVRRTARLRTQRLALLVTLLAPGAGQALRGRTLAGATLLLGWFSLAAFLLPGATLFADRVHWGAAPRWLSGGLLCGAALLVFGLGIRGARVPEEEQP